MSQLHCIHFDHYCKFTSFKICVDFIYLRGKETENVRLLVLIESVLKCLQPSGLDQIKASRWELHPGFPSEPPTAASQDAHEQEATVSSRAEIGTGHSGKGCRHPSKQHDG